MATVKPDGPTQMAEVQRMLQGMMEVRTLIVRSSERIAASLRLLESTAAYHRWPRPHGGASEGQGEGAEARATSSITRS